MQRVAILYDASQAVLSTFDLDEVLNQILAIVRDYFRLESGAVWMLDEDGRELRMRSSFGERNPEFAGRIAVGEGIAGVSARKRRPIYVPDVNEDRRYIGVFPGVRTELAIPLLEQQKVVGILSCHRPKVDAFDSETIDLLTLFAAQASIGIQNAKLYMLERRRARQLEAINTIAKQTTVELDLNEQLDRFCKQLPQSFDVDHVAVFLRDDEGQLVMHAQQGMLSSNLVQGQMLPQAANCLAFRAAGEGALQGPPLCARNCLEGARTEICLPLISFGENVGLLLCANGQPQLFPDNDVQALESVADILATAVQNSRYVERVKQMAYRDGLTGLFNRRHFETRVAEEISRAQRYGQPISLLMIDIDHFKLVNDDFGHLLGDDVLRQAAALFLRQLRKVDIVCRYGGEEFAVILPSTSLSSAVLVAEKLRRAVEQHSFPGVPRPVSVSIGVAEMQDAALGRDALVRPADEQLYQAKQGGRNRVEPMPVMLSVLKN